MRMCNKFVSVFLTVAMQLMCIQGISAEESSADYAYADFAGGSSVNMSVNCPMQSVEVDGVRAVKTNKASDNLYILCNVSDKFLYDVPLYTPVDITVEYYDSGNGCFDINYDSYNPQEEFYVETDIWESTKSAVKLTDSKTWKTHTFHIEDMRMTNRCTGGTDFRIAAWDPFMGTTPEEIIFKSVKVEKSELDSLEKIKKTTFDELAKVYTDEEEILFKQITDNKTDKAITVKYEFEYSCENSKEVYTYTQEEKFSPKEEREITIKLPNPKVYGIYSLKAVSKSYYDDNPSEVYEYSYSEDFSVKMSIPENGANFDYGMCIHPVEHGLGTVDEIDPLVKNVGAKFVRDCYRWSSCEREKGVYKFDETAKEKLLKIHNDGLEILFICAFTNPLYDNGGTPVSDEAIAAYAKYCAFMAKELKGITNYFEIWNEYNYGGMFNPTNEPPETYAKMLKAAYSAIKEVNPDAVIIGLCMGGVYPEWAKRVLDCGTYDYFDALSLHPYEYTDEFREYKFASDINEIKDLMKDHSNGQPLKPIWITEAGFTTATNSTMGFSDFGQAKNTILSYAFMKAYDLADRYFQYEMYHHEGRTDTEGCWGLIRADVGKGYKPLKAKPAYLAMTALNNIIGGSEFKNVIADDRFYAFNFYNNRMNKNVVLVQSGKGERIKNYNLGCNSADVYDMYGNKLRTIISDNGIYCIPVTETPKYIVGDFTSFEETAEVPPVTAKATIAECTSDDEVEFEFEKNTDKALQIEVTELKSAAVKSNEGFINGKARVVLQVQKQEIEDETIEVTIKDYSGNIYYNQQHTLKINPPTKTDIISEQAVENDNTLWRVRVKVTNNSNTKPQNGKVMITNPDDLAQKNAVKIFTGLMPGETIEYLFNLPKKVVKQTINLAVKTELENGYVSEDTSLLDFGVCTYTDKKPVIDGVISKNEWNGSWIGASDAADIREIKDWQGPDDLSFSSVTMWDKENFYFMGIVTDDIMSVKYSPQTASYMWKGDNIQFALDDRDYSYDVTIDVFTEIGLAQVPGEGDVVYRFKSLYSLPQETEVENAKLKISRHDTYTIYECAIPWSEIFDRDFVPKTDQNLRFSVLVNDNDGSGRRGWIEYMSGIGAKKSADLFGTLKLVK